MPGSPFARAFRSAVSNPEFTPEMKAKNARPGAPPRGLVHSPKGRNRGGFRPCTPKGDVTDTRRRVITKLHRMSGLRWRSVNGAPTHGRYLMREHRTGLASEAEAFFDGRAEGVDGVGFAERIQHDDHHYRVTIAPLDGDKLDAAEGGMQAYVRGVMASAEQDLRTRLEWVAVIHRKGDSANPANRHAHVILRGVTDRGQTLRLSEAYVRTGFKETCQRVATERLGRMSAAELKVYRERQAAKAERGREAGERAL